VNVVTIAAYRRI